MVAGSNQAASTRMFLVAGVIMVSQPPMTPASEMALRSSAMTRVVGGEGAGGSVEEAEGLSRVGEADDDAAIDPVEVEGVGGMAHGLEDVVGGVDGVEDLLEVEGGEVFGDAAGGGADGDVAEDAGGEAAAEGGLVDADGEGWGAGVGAGRVASSAARGRL